MTSHKTISTPDSDEHMRLDAQDLVSIHTALQHFKSLEVCQSEISSQNFPLSAELSARLKALCYNIFNGKCYKIIRGIKINDFPEADLILVYLGLASHVASDRADFLDHIRHATEAEPTELLRPTELPVAMDFHSDADAGTILSMMLISKAKSGGDQYIANFQDIFDDVSMNHPAVLATLSSNWHWEKPFRTPMSRPIIASYEGHPQINYGRTFVAGHPKYPRSALAPELTEDQIFALDVLRATAQKYAVKLDLQPGDIVFINNLGAMHARDAYVNGSTPSTTRHLLRLWMNDKTHSWRIAPQLRYCADDLFQAKAADQCYKSLPEWLSTPRGERLTNTSNAHRVQSDVKRTDTLKSDTSESSQSSSARTDDSSLSRVTTSGYTEEPASMSKRPEAGLKPPKQRPEALQARSHD